MARDDTARVSAAGTDSKELDTAIAADLVRRAKRVEGLGYRSVDAEFLTAVALLGGFFVRRQYRAFSCVGKGSAEVRLVGRARANGHVRVNGRKPALYRLCGASLFGAVGCDDPGSGAGRARRAAKQRLLVLDYWIAHIGEGGLLLTAAQKAAYFASLGIGEDCFPAATGKRQNGRKFFPEGFPIGAASPGSKSVRFTYAHAGSSAHGIERHLASHESLAAALAAARHRVRVGGAGRHRGAVRAPARCLASLAGTGGEGLVRGRVLRVAPVGGQAAMGATLQRGCRALRVPEQPSRLCRRGAALSHLGARRRAAAQSGGDFAASCKYREVLMEFDYAAADAASR